MDPISVVSLLTVLFQIALLTAPTSPVTTCLRVSRAAMVTPTLVESRLTVTLNGSLRLSPAKATSELHTNRNHNYPRISMLSSPIRDPLVT